MALRKLFPVLLAVVLILTSCAPAAQPAAADPVTLTVLAAASLTEAFQDLGSLYEFRNPGATVIFNFAGSQQLAQQITSGASLDVFASANEKYMQTVTDAGRVDRTAWQTLTRNRLVVIVSQHSAVPVESLAGLAQPGLKLVFGAEEVPAGHYTLEFLKKAAADPAYGPAYRQAVTANVVSYEDNVRSVLTKVALGEADAGVVYASDAAGEWSAKVKTVQIPDALNVVAVYPIATLNDAPHPRQAQAFVDLALSKDGQEILAAYGFMP